MQLGDNVIIKKLSVNGILLQHNGEVFRISNIIGDKFQVEGGYTFKEDDLVPLNSVVGKTIGLGKYVGKINYNFWGFLLHLISMKVYVLN